MAAKIICVGPDWTFGPNEVERLWFFPDGSEFLKYSPHFHVIYSGGFRQNLPLVYSFLVVLEGKLSVKSFYGRTGRRIDVRDQVWYVRGTDQRATQTYGRLLKGGERIPRPRKR